MAKKAVGKTGAAKRPVMAKTTKKTGAKAKGKPIAKRPARPKSQGSSDAVRKLLESPLVVDLLAVGATAALAAIAQHGFGKGEGRGAGKAIKQAGKAAATAMGQKLSSEFSEIRRATAKAKAGAKS